MESSIPLSDYLIYRRAISLLSEKPVEALQHFTRLSKLRDNPFVLLRITECCNRIGTLHAIKSSRIIEVSSPSRSASGGRERLAFGILSAAPMMEIENSASAMHRNAAASALRALNILNTVWKSSDVDRRRALIDLKISLLMQLTYAFLKLRNPYEARTTAKEVVDLLVFAVVSLSPFQQRILMLAELHYMQALSGMGSIRLSLGLASTLCNNRKLKVGVWEDQAAVNDSSAGTVHVSPISLCSGVEWTMGLHFKNVQVMAGNSNSQPLDDAIILINAGRVYCLAYWRGIPRLGERVGGGDFGDTLPDRKQFLTRAFSCFEAALQLRPDALEAIKGLVYVNICKGDNAAAYNILRNSRLIESFQ